MCLGNEKAGSTLQVIFSGPISGRSAKPEALGIARSKIDNQSPASAFITFLPVGHQPASHSGHSYGRHVKLAIQEFEFNFRFFQPSDRPQRWIVTDKK